MCPFQPTRCTRITKRAATNRMLPSCIIIEPNTFSPIKLMHITLLLGIKMTVCLYFHLLKSAQEVDQKKKAKKTARQNNKKEFSFTKIWLYTLHTYVHICCKADISKSLGVTFMRFFRRRLSRFFLQIFLLILVIYQMCSRVLRLLLFCFGIFFLLFRT